MNTYKLPVDAYSRTHEQTILEDAMKDIQRMKREEYLKGYKDGYKDGIKEGGTNK